MYRIISSFRSGAVPPRSSATYLALHEVSLPLTTILQPRPKKWLRVVFAWLVLLLFLASAIFATISWRDFTSMAINVPTTGVIFTVDRGAGIGKIAYQLEQAKIIPDRRVFRWIAMFKDQATKIQVGEYRLTADMTQEQVLQKMVSGLVVNYGFTIIEGWNLQQIMAALRIAEKVSVSTLDSAGISAQLDMVPAQLSASAAPGSAAVTDVEGLFWPETYNYTAGTNAVTLLQRANKLMQLKLNQLWQARAANCKLKNMYEAVIMASIIEKETKLPAEYAEISGVYQRRLQQNMRLQADPTIIYALLRQGEFSPPLNREHLAIDSPYNTYKNVGLPPTPIAVPGERALYAALHPAEGATLYFVADGKGGHVFSTTLEEHDAAVARYVRFSSRP